MDQTKRKYLLLLKLDAKNLLERLMERRDEYLEIFALRRTREHFEKIFFTRYHSLVMSELSHLDEETLSYLDIFYRHVDDLHWFMYSTQAMPGAVGEELDRYLVRLEKCYVELESDINEHLGIEESSVIDEPTETEEVPDIPNTSLMVDLNDIDHENEEI